ncbi:hypothetical protein Tsubulata_049479 [Turnera subulata]|uniref:RNA helicase n=1 Tax=Turnera subulata TaxID=218843 RepID=A0A9Q0FPC2_9ROSI|nr:hypothetical protein Tsubulata_049479 [Turnera subulata]
MKDVAEYRKSLAIRVSGFDDCGFSPQLMSVIAKQAYEKPTPIQCQALPIVLSGRDVIGMAKTGSGKTAAFVLPMIVHIMDERELAKEEGPIGVVCAPTRELAHQIYLETKKFAKSHGIRVSAVCGGMSKLDQFKELKAGCEIVIATPGRLIDMLKADRMFDLGFEPQIRSIVGQIRPDKQTLLFSATMPRKIEKLAREILSDPVRVTVGEVGTANEDITQVVQVIPSDAEKLPWLLEKLPGMIDEGDVLVFASKMATVDEIEAQLAQKGFKVAALHGDKDQASRMETLQKFKSGVYHVLVATDVRPAKEHNHISSWQLNGDIFRWTMKDVAEYRKSLAIRVSGFDDCGFSPQLMSVIAKQAYEKPTPIQCQALPIVLSGRDVIGMAKTGSGKTAAFVLPMIVHIMDERELAKEEGPIGVVCAPTRELAHQIYLETKKFAKSHGIRVSAVYGGMSKLDQFKELKAGCEIVIATPGRLIDMLKADRMFDLGFEPQIRSIVGQIRPDKQTLLFSATMPRKIEKLAREILSDPVRVTVGEVGTANEDITQV